MEYLKSNLMNRRGYSKVLGKPMGAQHAVALTADGRPVFGYHKIPAFTAKKLGWMVYDDEVERQRRLVADSLLAQIVLQKPKFVEPALKKVSKAIKAYWDVKKQQFNDDGYQVIVLGSWKYLYSDTSFGSMETMVSPDLFTKYSKLTKTIADEKSLIREAGKNPNPEMVLKLKKAQTDVQKARSIQVKNEMQKLKALIEGWMSAINESPLDIPKTMNLHDHFKRLFERILGPAELPLGPRPKPGQDQAWAKSPIYTRLKEIENKVRPEWYEDRQLRGRTSQYTNKSKDPKKNGILIRIKPKSTSMPGLITQDFTIPITGAFYRCGLDTLKLKLESHIQGRSRYVTDATNMEETFRKVLVDHNIPFSASASGTTSTLFMSARMFANLTEMEDLKQYLLGCVAYLVGGGMHTCHEVFWTGGLINIPYIIGKYSDTLPKSFTRSRDYEKWLAEFWDIARPDRKKA